MSAGHWSPTVILLVACNYRKHIYMNKQTRSEIPGGFFLLQIPVATTGRRYIVKNNSNYTEKHLHIRIPTGIR